MALHPLAGKPAPQEMLIDPARLEREYFANRPDPGNPAQAVTFGTSGHRGTTANATFTETHILAITQAICDYRRANSIDGPLFLGKDTHALSYAAHRSAVEVLAANGVQTFIQGNDGATPTPVVSHAILTYNRGRRTGLADGVLITPSHNPPADGGFKYNPPDGGPADTDVTNWIQDRANSLLASGTTGVRRSPFEAAIRTHTIEEHDYITGYVSDLDTVIDFESIRAAQGRIRIDPLGGASAAYWAPIAERYGLNVTVVNPAIDPTFSFMTVDHDGKIRMDCSSPYAMAGLVRLKDQFDIAWGNDPDADRHGIVTPSAGLMNPNHYLAVAIEYLLENRPLWNRNSTIGKTIVSSSVIDRVVNQLGRKLWEVPVGFKWFAPALYDGRCCFGGEESAGASFLRRDGNVWTTDKDGLILGLLAAEITARTGRDPGERYASIADRLGAAWYTRVDAPATSEQKAAFQRITPASLGATALAGDPIVSTLTHAPGNNASIGGLKVTTDSGWFAARPSGTENILKLYAESFRGADHLAAIIADAQSLIAG